ncbi:MAG: DUF3501 family protein [Planctomycetia bacterium]|nr:DUF3501 family protein [Planctomycetia bacterium]
MEPLELDDLLPLEEFAARRREFFLAHARYLDRHRRVRLGPCVTLVFENRQTLWFRLQEVIRIARLTEPTRLRQELAHYNRLLPRSGCLQAALLLEIDETKLAAELARWRDLHGDQLTLHLGSTLIPADLLTSRPEDRAIGTAHWVQFALDEENKCRLMDRRFAAGFRISMPGYVHESGALGDDVRESLASDLGGVPMGATDASRRAKSV